MARKIRIEYPGAVYHVMSRGNQGQPMFKTEEDQNPLLKDQGESCQVLLENSESLPMR